MKKILLCTTALVGLAAGSAFASDDVKVSFEGQSKFEAGTKRQDTNHKAPLSFSPNQKSSAFYTTQKASLKAEGKADSLTYGAVLRLEMVGNSSDGMSDARNSRSHIYIDTDAGSVQLGSNFAASKLMQVDASTIASATGGIDGDWTNFAAMPDYSSSLDISYVANGVKVSSDAAAKSIAASSVITSVDTLSNRLDSNSESSRKITYMSPRISGLQLGLSFAPDLNNNGGNNILTSNNINKDGTISSIGNLYFGAPVRVKNAWSLGLNYTNSINDVKVALSAVADIGKAEKQTIVPAMINTGVVVGDVTIIEQNSSGESFTGKSNDLKTYSLGAVVGTNGFSVAASYHNDGKSLTEKDSNLKSSWWTAGVAYENGPASVSLTYLSGKKSDKSDNSSMKTQVVSLGADYEVAPGLKPFAEVTMVNFKPKNSTSSNQIDTTKAKATVFLIGTKLKF